MAARMTTAPTLTYILDQREAGGLEPEAQRLGDEARAELRALLRVARAVERVKPYTPGWQERMERVFECQRGPRPRVGSPAQGRTVMAETCRGCREARRFLRDLTQSVDHALSLVDAEMQKPSDEGRGRRIAAIANGLDLQNQIAKRYGLAARQRKERRR